jgi:hypothetical protein
LTHASVAGKLQWFLPDTSPNQPAPPLPSFVQTSSNSGYQCRIVKRRFVCTAVSTSPSPGD